MSISSMGGNLLTMYSRSNHHVKSLTSLSIISIKLKKIWLTTAFCFLNSQYFPISLRVNSLQEYTRVISAFSYLSKHTSHSLANHTGFLARQVPTLWILPPFSNALHLISTWLISLIAPDFYTKDILTVSSCLHTLLTIVLWPLLIFFLAQFFSSLSHHMTD